MDKADSETEEKNPAVAKTEATESSAESSKLATSKESSGETAAEPPSKEDSAMDVDDASPPNSSEQDPTPDGPPDEQSKKDDANPSDLGEVKEEPLATGATSASSSRLSKKRSRSPDIEPSSADGATTLAGTAKDPPSSSTTSATVTQQHQVAAVSAASAAAAAQLSLSMGWNGLYSLLSASSMTTATAQSLSTGHAAIAGVGAESFSTSGGGSSSSISSSLPTVEQVKQAALKSLQEAPIHVHLSKTDSAPQLKIVDDQRLIVRGGMRGYRMSRATHGISSGNYYYEAIILDPPKVSEIVSSLPPNARLGRTLQSQLQQALLEEENGVPLDQRTSTFGGHVRLGWSMRTGDLQAPVGYDKWSYGVRDIGGSKIHCSRRDDNWGGEDFAPGDVVGCAICLSGNSDSNSTNGDANNNGNNNNSKNAPGSDKDAPGPGSTANKESALAGSETSNHIRFFKNGYPMGNFVISKGKREGGIAFNVPGGVYYPAISLYMGASVKVNFGPNFIYQPKKLPPAIRNSLKPVSDLYQPSKPMTVQDAVAKAQKEKTFRKPDMMAKFVELVKTEAQILQEAHNNHCKKHILYIQAEREKRNLSTADLDVPSTPAAAEEAADGDAAGSTDGDAEMQDADKANPVTGEE